MQDGQNPITAATTALTTPATAVTTSLSTSSGNSSSLKHLCQTLQTAGQILSQHNNASSVDDNKTHVQEEECFLLDRIEEKISLAGQMLPIHEVASKSESQQQPQPHLEQQQPQQQQQQHQQESKTVVPTITLVENGDDVKVTVGDDADEFLDVKQHSKPQSSSFLTGNDSAMAATVTPCCKTATRTTITGDDTRIHNKDGIYSTSHGKRKTLPIQTKPRKGEETDDPSSPTRNNNKRQRSLLSDPSTAEFHTSTITTEAMRSASISPESSFGQRPKKESGNDGVVIPAETGENDACKKKIARAEETGRRAFVPKAAAAAAVVTTHGDAHSMLSNETNETGPLATSDSTALQSVATDADAAMGAPPPPPPPSTVTKIARRKQTRGKWANRRAAAGANPSVIPTATRALSPRGGSSEAYSMADTAATVSVVGASQVAVPVVVPNHQSGATHAQHIDTCGDRKPQHVRGSDNGNTGKAGGGDYDDDDDGSCLGLIPCKVKTILPPSRKRQATDAEETERKRQWEVLNTVRDMAKRGWSQKSVQARLREMINEKEYDDSLRRIPTELFEPFGVSNHDLRDHFEIIVMDYSNKTSKCFDEIVDDLVDNAADVKAAMLDLARSQAMKDERLQRKEMELDNFRLVISYGQVEAQPPRIDVPGPNHQFCMLLTPGLGIQGFSTRHQIRSATDLRHAWERADALDQGFGLDPEPMPVHLTVAMNQNNTVNTILSEYGNLLLPDEELTRDLQQQQHHSAGTVFSWPDGAMYARPKSSRFQAMLLYTAFPPTKDIPVKHTSDTHHTSVFLCDRLLRCLWRQQGIGYAERLYLVKKLYRYIRQGGNTAKENRVNWHWSSLLAKNGETGPLAEFIEKMERDNTEREMDLKWADYVARNVWAVPKIRRRPGQAKMRPRGFCRSAG